MSKFTSCAKFKLGKFFGNSDDTYSSEDDLKKQYAIRHSVQGCVVRVSIYDTHTKSCLYKQNKMARTTSKSSVTHKVIEHSTGRLLYLDVEEPKKAELTAGITYVDKIKEAYQQLQAEVDELNYVAEAPMRAKRAAAEAAKIVDTFKKE
jgi:hypothetical protein